MPEASSIWEEIPAFVAVVSPAGIYSYATSDSSIDHRRAYFPAIQSLGFEIESTL
jgi:hypothetical protein